MTKARPTASMKTTKDKPTEIDVEPGELFATLELTVKDKNGNITERRTQKSKSLVRQFLELLFAQSSGFSETYFVLTNTAKDITNTQRFISASSSMLKCNAGAGTTTNGVVVGSGDTAPTINDYALETQIGHGVAADQLQYGAMTFGEPAAGASISQFRLTRDFANGSGGAVDVKEIGLYVSDGSNDYMTIRDALGTPISVPDGQTLTVNYQIQGAI